MNQLKVLESRIDVRFHVTDVESDNDGLACGCGVGRCECEY